jgi:hypothetical protein
VVSLIPLPLYSLGKETGNCCVRDCVCSSGGLDNTQKRNASSACREFFLYCTNFFLIPFYLQSVLLHSATCVKTFTMTCRRLLRILLLMETFDLRPSIQYILVKMIPIVYVLRKCRRQFCLLFCMDVKLGL